MKPKYSVIAKCKVGDGFEIVKYRTVTNLNSLYTHIERKIGFIIFFTIYNKNGGEFITSWSANKPRTL